MHKGIFGAVAAALLVAQGLTSQEAQAQEEEAYGYAEAFTVEPLTPEQEARLPTARRVMELALPAGSYSETLGGAFGVSTSYLEEIEPDPFSALYSALAYHSGVGEIASAKAVQAMAILDPAWRERQQVQLDYQDFYGRQMMERLEPVMRDAMTELYAIRFTQAELEDIEAFFRTESGAAYARQALSMGSDPRVSTAIYSRPDLWEQAALPDPSALDAALAALPAARTFADLTPRERGRLAALTGLTEAELEEAMRQAVEMNAAVEAAVDAAAEAADEHGH